MRELKTEELIVRLCNNQVRITKHLIDGPHVPKRELDNEAKLVSELSERLNLDEQYIKEKLAE